MGLFDNWFQRTEQSSLKSEDKSLTSEKVIQKMLVNAERCL